MVTFHFTVMQAVYFMPEPKLLLPLCIHLPLIQSQNADSHRFFQKLLFVNLSYSIVQNSIKHSFFLTFLFSKNHT